ncbi:hypothetical protein [Actinacidiphila acididurans]|uniref:Uncharacterized protein n=1 Tax=Actinacidiphila acididurans TaxID=2784346 RepID=A0ABS2U332_9ACTN|nr:hypothetical protein [Actinacidiphila acididurans]MBM9510003.1 hypothetical protein [Actinacidiphila acididurans]
MRAAVRRAAQRVGHRGALLVLLGTIALLYGASLITTPPVPHPIGLRLLLGLMPLKGWGYTLAAAGGIAVLCAPLRQGRDWPGFTVLVLVWLPWSLSFLTSWWPQGENPRGWVSALIFAALAGVPAACAGWEEPGEPPRRGSP